MTPYFAVWLSRGSVLLKDLDNIFDDGDRETQVFDRNGELIATGIFVQCLLLHPWHHFVLRRHVGPPAQMTCCRVARFLMWTSIPHALRVDISK